MKKPCFRIQIALLSAAISGLVMVTFGWAALLIFARQRIESLDTQIRTLGSRQPGWLAVRRDFPRFEENLGFVVGGDGSVPGILLAKDAAGKVLYQSAGWPSELDPADFTWPLADATTQPPAQITPAGDTADERDRGPGRITGAGTGQMVCAAKVSEFRSVRTREGCWRIGMFATADTTLVIGLNAAVTETEMAHLRRSFLLALPVALAMVGLGGWVVGGRALRPLRVIAETAARVTARGLDQRIPVATKDPEIVRLITMLNGMMDRLEESFRQATRFSADASHELRTPLAIMRGELENALQEAVPGSPAQQTFSGMLEEIQRLGSITQSLLLLARADAGQLAPTLETVDLTGLLREILEDAAVLAEAANLDLQVEPLPRIAVTGDAVLLRTAFLNLLTNAVKYNEPGGSIRVSLRTAGADVLLEIGNSGPGIPAADQPHVFRRFHRADRARERRIDGLGLGLSLTREILHANHATVDLLASRPGWTRFEVRLRRL